MKLNQWETAGLTVLEHLIAFIVPAAAAKNPRYSEVIKAASDGVQAELSSIAAGNAPTLHDPGIIQLAAAGVAGGATAAIANTGNATTASLIGGGAAAVESALADVLSAAQPKAPAPGGS